METKYCKDCETTKDITEFAYKDKANNRRQNNCKDCHKIYVKKHYDNNKAAYKKRASTNTPIYIERNKQKIIEYLQQRPCTKCTNKDVDVLEFHHLADKKHNISAMVLSAYSWKAIQKEISKCIVLCANCHRKLHKQLWRE